MARELGGGDNTEAFGEVEVICSPSIRSANTPSQKNKKRYSSLTSPRPLNRASNQPDRPNNSPQHLSPPSQHLPTQNNSLPTPPPHPPLPGHPTPFKPLPSRLLDPRRRRRCLQCIGIPASTSYPDTQGVHQQEEQWKERGELGNARIMV